MLPMVPRPPAFETTDASFQPLSLAMPACTMGCWIPKALVKFVGSKGKCFEKCITNEFNGKIPPGSCTQPSPSDAATMACISKTTTKSAATIDKACATAGANPACYTGGFATGSGWVATVEGAVDSALPGTFCGSPSAAFLN